MYTFDTLIYIFTFICSKLISQKSSKTVSWCISSIHLVPYTCRNAWKELFKQCYNM